MRQTTTIKRFLHLILLLVLTSCGQNPIDNKTSQPKDTTSPKVEHSIHDTNLIRENVRHETFNETIDTLPDLLKAFIPSNYSAINISSGDANLDGISDKILVLRKNSEVSTSNYAEDKPDKRPFLLLLGQPNGNYQLAIRNDNAVYCIDCGGVFGDPFMGTTIKNGYFSIEHGISGGQHWEQVTTFKFDKTKRNWFLYKVHFISYKLNSSNDENAEALVKKTEKLETENNFGIVPFKNFDIYNEKRH